MRISADWMNLVDERILEYLQEEGPATPTKMNEDGRFTKSRPYINLRCGELEDYGMVRNLGNGVYQITELGEAYLNEELDATTLDPNTSGSSRAAV